MNPPQDIDTDYFQAKLLAARAELEELLKLGAEDGATVELDQTSIGRLSRMDAMQRQAMALETERRRLREIQRIDAALKRIEQGEYGYCLATGEPIPMARLELDPAAATLAQKPGDA
jgi:DnaK suppressor protein